MFRLTVLGQIDLRDDSGSEVRAILAQPKRLALLVYLASTSPRRFHQRDALLPLFWPELPQSRARNALRQALHQLRRTLGDDVVLSRGAESVGLSDDGIACDLAECQVALDRGQLDSAVRIYAGDLLPGFHVEGAGQFNQWLDNIRNRLRDRAARSAWALAEQHERARNFEAAAASGRRALELTLDEAALRQLMTLLDRIGDSAGAIRAYEEFAIRSRRELELEPSPASQQLVASLRKRHAAQGAGTPPPAANAAAVSAPAARSSGRATVRVATFENLTGDASVDFIGRLVSSAIAQALGATRVVDVIADGDGMLGANARSRLAGIIIAGSFHATDAGWQVNSTLRGDKGQNVGNVATIVAPRERPWEAAQEAGRRVSGTVAAHLDERLESWADAVSEPPSFEAHRSHVTGMELHLRGDFRGAIPHFLAAAHPESGFAIPLLWAMQASCNLEEYEQAAAIHAELATARPRLAKAEQLMCDYFGVWLNGDRGAALRLVQRVAQMVPDSEVLAQLGRDALLFNHPGQAVAALERMDPERGWMPSWTPYWRRLTEAYHMLGDHAAERDAAERGRGQHPEAMSTLLYLMRACAALGDVDAVDRTADEAIAMASDPFATAGEVLYIGACELRAHGRALVGEALARRAVAWQLERLATEPVSKPGQLMLARMYCEARQWRDAAKVLSALRRDLGDDLDVIGCAGVVAARMGDTDAARGALASLRSKTGRYHYGRHLIWCARIAAVLGETDDALNYLRGAFARGAPYSVELHSDADLALLAHDARFRELMRAKG